MKDVWGKHAKIEVPQEFIDMMRDDCDTQDYQSELTYMAFEACLKKYDNLILCKDCGKALRKDRPVDSDNITDDTSRCGEMHSIDHCMKCHLVHDEIGQRIFEHTHYLGENTRGVEFSGCSQCGSTGGGQLSSGRCSACR